MTAAPLHILAGATARASIAAEGFHPDLFSTLVGASGGPKWFVLSRLDRLLAAEFFSARTKPLACLGSSIGSWRHACHAQADPVAALARLEHCYIHQHYSDKPSQREVSAVAQACVDHILGPDGAREVIESAVWRSHILCVRSRWPVASDSLVPLALGLGACAIGNAASRKSLRRFFHRALFHSGEKPDIRCSDLSTENTRLGPANLAAAILSSGSIPLIMEGVRNIPDAPSGTYRDGGITDYHFDFEFDHPGGLVLYPHFYRHVTPGWYDKPLPWRRVHGAALDNVVLLAPGDEFVAGLPYGKIPDRSDFRQLDERQRIAYWQRVCAESERLADAFGEAWQKGTLASLIRPLS